MMKATDMIFSPHLEGGAITARDHIAIQAISGKADRQGCDCAMLAKDAYQLAYAMIEQSEKEDG